MVNNGVHWASDYPLAVGIGAVIGKTVAARGRTLVRTYMPTVAPDSGRRARWQVDPVVSPSFVGFRATW
jgi:hypothetical protein